MLWIEELHLQLGADGAAEPCESGDRAEEAACLPMCQPCSREGDEQRWIHACSKPLLCHSKQGPQMGLSPKRHQLLSADLPELFQNATSAPPQGSQQQFSRALTLLTHHKTQRPAARPAGPVLQAPVPSRPAGSTSSPMAPTPQLGVSRRDPKFPIR